MSERKLRANFDFCQKTRESRIFVTPSFSVCRGKRIRTFDPLLPKQLNPIFSHFQPVRFIFKYFIFKYLRSNDFFPIFACLYKYACKLRANFANKIKALRAHCVQIFRSA